MQSHDTRELKDWVFRTFESMKAVRQKTEQARWDAYAMMGFRTQDTKARNQLITPTKLYSARHKIFLQTMVNGIMANLISPNIKWFKFDTRGINGEKADDLPGAAVWMEDCESREMQHFNDSYFYSETKLAVKDALIGGTSFEIVYDDARNGRIIHDTLDPQDCWIDENDAHMVDTLVHDFTMTVHQCVDKFGYDKLPQKVRQLYDDKAYNKDVELLHMIIPKDHIPADVRPNGIPVAKPVASIWICVDADEVFQVGGYSTLPFAIHRWERDDATPYGIGLVMRIMPNLFEYQKLYRLYGVGVERQVNPVIYAPQALKGKFDYRPGAINYGNPQTDGAPVPINTVIDVQHAAERIMQLEASLQQIFYNDLFSMLAAQDSVQRTKYEVQRIEGRRLMLLSGIIGNMQVEKINPLVKATLDIMMRNGQTLPIPQSMIQKTIATDIFPVSVELNGLLAQNLKAYQQTIGLEDGISAIALMGKIYPQCFVNFDFDEIARQYAIAKGLPKDCLYDKVKVMEIKRQMLAQQQALSNQQQALNSSQVAKNLEGVNLDSMIEQSLGNYQSPAGGLQR